MIKNRFITLIVAIVIATSTLQSLAWGETKGEGVSTGVETSPTPLSPGQNSLRPLAAAEKANKVILKEKLTNDILAVLPVAQIDDAPEMAAYIAEHFGDQWEEAISLMGSHLINREKRPLVERALNKGVSILRLASILNYKDFLDKGVTFETFPASFQDIILDNSRPLKFLVVGTDIDALWAIYSTVRPEWREAIKEEPERIEVLDELRHETATWLAEEGMKIFSEPAAKIRQWDDNRLIRRALEAIKRFYQAKGYLKVGSENTRPLIPEIITIPHSGPFKFINGEKGLGPYGGQFIFNVWLSDPDLLQQLMTVPPAPQQALSYMPLSGEIALHLSSIVYTHGQDAGKPVFKIRLLQSWLRLSKNDPAALREKLGALDELTERTFRDYAAQRNIRFVLAPCGDQTYKSAVMAIHPNTVERLNNIFRNAGYKLVFNNGDWWWQFDFENAPPALVSNSGLARPDMKLLQESI